MREVCAYVWRSSASSQMCGAYLAAAMGIVGLKYAVNIKVLGSLITELR